jgi:hypothetical protein
MKIISELWDKNQDNLRQAIKEEGNFNSYKDLVQLAFEVIWNNSNYDRLNTDAITEIDDGQYQGTLVYLIPFDTYQPSYDEYLMTNVWYGSCSGCDSLQYITDGSWEVEERIKMYLNLCKDILANTIRPYNFGWHYDSKYGPADDSPYKTLPLGDVKSYCNTHECNGNCMFYLLHDKKCRFGIEPHKWNLEPERKFLESEIENAKALKQVIVTDDSAKITRYDDYKGLYFVPSEKVNGVALENNFFPSIKVGETYYLNDIIGE